MSTVPTDDNILERNDAVREAYQRAARSGELHDIDRAWDLDHELTDDLLPELHCPDSDHSDPKIEALGEGYWGRTAEGSLVVTGQEHYLVGGVGSWTEFELLDYDELEADEL